jgi:hypothetical protein
LRRYAAREPTSETIHHDGKAYRRCEAGA